MLSARSLVDIGRAPVYWGRMSVRSFFESIAKLFGKAPGKSDDMGRSPEPPSDALVGAPKAVVASGESREIPVNFIQTEDEASESGDDVTDSESVSIPVDVSEPEPEKTEPEEVEPEEPEAEEGFSVAVEISEPESKESFSIPVVVSTDEPPESPAEEASEASEGDDPQDEDAEEPYFEWVEVPLFSGIGGYLPPQLNIDRVGAKGTRRAGTIGGRRNEAPAPRSRRSIP